MFWNLTLQPGKQYSSTIDNTFHLSMAALDVTSAKNDNDIYPVLLNIDGKDTVLCNLNKSQFLQVNLDHMFEKGSKVTFYTSGKAVIHLTGYLVQDEFDSSDMSDGDSSLSDLSTDEALSKEGKGDFKSEAQKKNKRKADVAEEVAKKKVKPKSGDDDEKGVDMSMNTLNHKKYHESSDSDDEDDDDDDDDSNDDFDSYENLTLGDDEDDDDDDDEDDDDESDEDSDFEDSDDDDAEKNKPKGQKTPQQTPKKKPDEKTPNQGKHELQKQTPGGSTKKQNKQQNQSLTNGATPKSEKKDNKGTPQQPKQGSGSPQKRTLAGGVHVEELKKGNGPVAKPGKMVAVYYTGRLKSNNRVFDQTQKGPGFKFRLGKGEVIKGWDVGVAGMAVGSKRRITCPAAMAYGSKGSPPEIPPNAILVFDVELKSVNN